MDLKAAKPPLSSHRAAAAPDGTPLWLSRRPPPRRIRRRPAAVPRIRRPGAALRLAGMVFVDILRSNLAVGRIIVSSRQPGVNAGFMTIPLMSLVTFVILLVLQFFDLKSQKEPK